MTVRRGPVAAQRRRLEPLELRLPQPRLDRVATVRVPTDTWPRLDFVISSANATSASREVPWKIIDFC